MNRGKRPGILGIEAQCDSTTAHARTNVVVRPGQKIENSMIKPTNLALNVPKLRSTRVVKYSLPDRTAGLP